MKKIRFICACLNLAKELDTIKKSNKEVFKEFEEIIERVKNLSPKLAQLIKNILGLLK